MVLRQTGQKHGTMYHIAPVRMRSRNVDPKSACYEKQALLLLRSAALRDKETHHQQDDNPRRFQLVREAVSPVHWKGEVRWRMNKLFMTRMKKKSNCERWRTASNHFFDEDSWSLKTFK